MEGNPKNEKEKISRHYKEVREIISRSLQETNLSFSVKNEDENKFFSEIKKTLAEEDETFKQEIDELRKISDWENFCISFFGETNAGKSTIIETLRIIYDEESRRKEIEKNSSRVKVFLKKLLLKMGFKAGTESQLGRFLKSDGNVVDGAIIGTGRSDFTKDVTGYKLYFNGKSFKLYDVPGIEGDESKFEQVIQKAVDKAHLIFYVNGTSKKIEPGTAEKLKKYLKNYTDVYSIINIHFPPKKNRDLDIDDSYSVELQKEYSKVEGTIKSQTDKVLKDVLAENYKESVMLNGLSAFCAHAYDQEQGHSTIIPDNPKDNEKKMLNANQEKFFAEYESDIAVMKQDSRIHEITNIISRKAESFVPDIVESNKKKLLARLDGSFSKIQQLKSDSNTASENFVEQYTQMITSAKAANDQFRTYIKKNYITRVVTHVVDAELDEFYNLINFRDGKVKKDDYERHFNSRRQVLEEGIQDGLKHDFEEQVQLFTDAIKKAQDRFDENVEGFLEFSLVDFPALSNVDFGAVHAQMKYGMKNFGKDALNVGLWALTGAGVGSIIPGVGTVVGGIIGAIVGGLAGILSSVIGFVQGRDKRIAKAREKAREIFNTIKYDLIDQLEQAMDLNRYLQDVENTTEGIIGQCERAIEQFESTVKLLESLVAVLAEKQRKIQEMPYGKI